MIRYGFNTIIFLINNGGYTIEVGSVVCTMCCCSCPAVEIRSSSI